MCRAVKTSGLPSTSLSVGQSGGFINVPGSKNIWLTKYILVCRSVRWFINVPGSKHLGKTSGLPSTSLSVGQSGGSINVPGSKNIWLTKYILVCRSVRWVYQCAGQ